MHAAFQLSRVIKLIIFNAFLKIFLKTLFIKMLNTYFMHLFSFDWWVVATCIVARTENLLKCEVATCSI